MIGLSAGSRIWLAAGITDMRAGMNGLAARVETALAEDPFSCHVLEFRGWRGDMIKVLWWTDDGLCLLANRLERGRFVWPQADSGSMALTHASNPENATRASAASRHLFRPVDDQPATVALSERALTGSDL